MKEGKKNRPPKWADNFLEWYCSPQYIDEIQGDLHEAFQRRCENGDIRWEKFYFVTEVLRSISIRTIDTSFYSPISSFAMFKNYLKCGWRNFIKYKSYSLINIFGLALGFSAALLLFLIIRYENSFDRFHTKVDQIYRVGNSYTTGGFDDLIVTPQIPAMEKEYPDIIHASRFFALYDIVANDDRYSQISSHLVDPGFSEMFDFKMVKGNLRQALSLPNQIVLTKSVAAKLFGYEDPIGKSLSFVNEKIHFTVAAIAEDPPKNSTLQFETLISWENAPAWLDVDQSGSWYNTFMHGYIQVTQKHQRRNWKKN